jgi:glycerate dehydrogenase
VNAGNVEVTLKLVVLDGWTLNPGDLSWDELRSSAVCEIHDRTPSTEIATRARGVEAILTNKTPLREETLAALPALRYIGVLATGYDVVDVEQARKQGIVVTNIPEYGTPSVAQAVFALLLELTNHAGMHSEAVRSGEWTRGLDWCFWRQPLVELSGKTMGIVGCGRIGTSVARIAAAFGMDVIVTSSRPLQNVPEGSRWLPLDELLAQSDVVSLHCPLRAETRGLIDAARLERMKPTAMLINTSRGALIVEEDLATALRCRKLAGAAVDVLSVEPPAAGNPLIGAPNCIVTRRGRHSKRALVC